MDIHTFPPLIVEKKNNTMDDQSYGYCNSKTMDVF
uniref:Uncharacterized protein n=1 Tax=Nelumbo nucifera TaxID=4432 RepID=A0A822XPQ3_NELNU|nr:TPA_asm: hypothetical protein HUJ06_023873 [Nelumbo nucifera]